MRLYRSSKPNMDAVFLRYGDLLYRLALVRLGNDADAQDVVQDVFLKYLTARPSFESESHEKAWFLRVAVNRCHDLARKQNALSFVSLEDAYSVAAPEEGTGELIARVAQLPSIYKDTVILHALEGFTLAETAEILEISLSAAKMRLTRAREMLQILRKEEEDV